MKRIVIKRPIVVFILILIAVSLPDLFSPPISSTIWRQCQTAMLTENFVKSGFRLHGLTVDIFGDENPMMIQEFPLYHILTGILFKITGINIFWGKLISLLAGARVFMHNLQFINKVL